MRSPNITAPQVIVLINGRVFGEVTGWSFNASTPNAPLHGIDQTFAFELAPGAVGGSGSIQALRLHGSGGLEGRGVVAPMLQIPTQQYFSMLLVNRRNRSTLWRADHCAVDGQVLSIEARERVGVAFQFRCISFSNEVDDAVATFSAANIGAVTALGTP